VDVQQTGSIGDSYRFSLPARSINSTELTAYPIDLDNSANMRGRPRSSTREFEDLYNDLDAKYFPRPRANLIENGRVTATLIWPDGKRTSQTLDLVVTRPYFGGARYWYECPRCKARRRKLYAADDGRGIGCRACLGLIYYCQYRKTPRARLFRMVRRYLVEQRQGRGYFGSNWPQDRASET